ncbi:MAG: 2-oxo acid dehydrogenase subunit E2 [Spirochaetales bacterium]|nr:2-oxo acid dehydrogenase subunit E2 [Spirochaetales bacterium]
MSSYQTKNIPLSRLATFDVGVIGNKKHHVTGLIEIDITEGRKEIRSRIRNGENLSLNAWILKCFADAIAENPQVQGMLYGKKRIVSFEDVDLSIMIERSYKEELVPLVAVIKKVNCKSIEQIHNEIEVLKKKEIQTEKDFVLSDTNYAGQWLYYRLPAFLRVKIMEKIMQNPFKRKDMMGTALVTNVGGLSSMSGWIIPKSIHNLSFGIGSINKKPKVIGNEIQIRDIMHLTVLLDHNVLDGAPAARFTASLARKFEWRQ